MLNLVCEGPESGDGYSIRTQENEQSVPWISGSTTIGVCQDVNTSFLSNWGSLQNDDTRIFANDGVLKP